MNKLDFFKYSFLETLYLNRAWGLSTFAVSTPDKSTLDTVGFYIDDNKCYTSQGEITDYVPEHPLFRIDEKVTLTSKDFPFIHKDIVTTYGILYMNLILIWYPYEGELEYINGVINPKVINSLAYDLLQKSNDSERHRRFENGVSFISALSQVSVPSATLRSITPNPKIPKLKKQLLFENKDTLDDPVTITNIQNQLSAADRNYLKDDRSMGFLTKNKDFDVKRLRSYGMYGAEPDFNDETKIQVMVPSLNEGWDINNIPMLINNIRGGSYARAASTALGGAEVKTTARVFQNYTIAEQNCGTTVGLPVDINDNNINMFIGRYLVGSLKPLGQNDLLNKKGKRVIIRSPYGCITKGTSVCQICMGDKVSKGGVGINGLVTVGISSFLGFFMSLTHTTALSTARYSFKDRIN